MDDLNRAKYLRKTIRISALLWVHLNIVEILNKCVAEQIQIWIDKNKVETTVAKSYLKMFKPNKHPELGRTIDIMINLNLLDKKDDSVFNSNHFIRNKLSHANLFYDPGKKTIMLNDGTEYPFNEFKKDLRDLYNFLKEYIVALNNYDTELETVIESALKEITKLFKRIHRDGNLKRAYGQVMCDWRNKKV